MGRQIKGLLYFNFTESRHSLTIFWTILMGILVVSLFASYLLRNVEGGSFSFSLTIPMYIYIAIFGFLSVKERIPYSLKLGATRKYIFISLGIFFLVLSTVMGIAGSIIQMLVNLFNTNVDIGTDKFTFLHIAHLMNDTWYNRILIDSSIMFFSVSILFMFGLLFYRYGLAGGGSVLGLMVVAILVGFAQGWLADFFIYLFERLDMLLFYEVFIIGLVFYCLSFLLIRKITIVKAN